MKAFQKVGPQLPEFSYPFIPRGKTPTCLNSSSHHVVSRRFFITSFNLPIVPLKRGPIRWSGFCRHSSVTPPVISQHLFSVLSLYDDVLGTSCIDPLSVFSYFSAELTMYGWLCEQRGREFYIGAIAFFFFLVGICFLFYPVETWNLICNDMIRSSSSPSTRDVKKEPVRLVHGNVSWIFWWSQLDVRHDWVHTHTHS